MPRKPRDAAPQVYTLLVDLGRQPGDPLPDGATGAGLLVYAPGTTEAEAVRETVALLKTAGMQALDVTSYGTLAERESAGDTVPEEERALMARALDEDVVIVAQKTWFGDEDDDE